MARLPCPGLLLLLLPLLPLLLLLLPLLLLLLLQGVTCMLTLRAGTCSCGTCRQCLDSK
jgi:hypothetical protein